MTSKRSILNQTGGNIRTFIVLTSSCVICEARSGAYEVVFEENKYNGSHELTSATAEEH